MILLKLETKTQKAAFTTFTLTFASHPNYKGTHRVVAVNSLTPLTESKHCRYILKGLTRERYNLVKPLKPFFRTKVKILLKGLFKWS